MDKDHRSTLSHLSSGGLIRFQARLTDLIAWIGPGWAALCGVIASGGFGWQGEDFLLLSLLILLVDGGWGTVWSALGNTNWAAALRDWRSWRDGQPMARLPYTQPGSPGNRMSQWLGQLRAWWQNVLWATCGPAISAIIVALPVTVILGAALGPEHLLLSAAALAAMQLGLAWAGGRGDVAPGWDAIIAIALPWLAGHLAFGPLTTLSASMAVLFALVWGGVWLSGSILGRALVVGGQMVVVGVLIALQRPLAAGALLLLLVPQFFLIPWLQRGSSASWFVRHVRPWLMAGMLIAVWAL